MIPMKFSRYSSAEKRFEILLDNHLILHAAASETMEWNNKTVSVEVTDENGGFDDTTGNNHKKQETLIQWCEKEWAEIRGTRWSWSWTRGGQWHTASQSRKMFMVLGGVIEFDFSWFDASPYGSLYHVDDFIRRERFSDNSNRWRRFWSGIRVRRIWLRDMRAGRCYLLDYIASFFREVAKPVLASPSPFYSRGRPWTARRVL